VRFIGGDETLIGELRHNAAVQATLPAEHPLAIFGDEVTRKRVLQELDERDASLKRMHEELEEKVADLLKRYKCVDPRGVPGH
jgi:hypothetical protein